MDPDAGLSAYLAKMSSVAPLQKHFFSLEASLSAAAMQTNGPKSAVSI